MAYGITKKSQLIDVASINSGCDIIDGAALDFVKSATKIEESASYCGEKALSVDGKTMQPTIDELAVNVKAIEEQIKNFTAGIRAAATDIYNKQKVELQEYLEEQKKKKEDN